MKVRLLVSCLMLGTIAIPSASAETISPRRLLEVGDLGNPAISPDGRSVAFRVERASVERNTYDTVWYVQELDGLSPPRRVADGGAPLREYVNGVVLPSPAVWSPDGRWIYYRARLDGRVSVWRAARDGSEAKAVTSDAADVRDFILDGGGRMLVYSVGATREEVIAAEEAEYDQGVRIDDTVMVAAGLFRSSRIDGRSATQRFLGEWFSSAPLLAGLPDRWKAVDLETMRTRDLPPSQLPVRPPTVSDLPRGLPEPSRIAVHPGDGRIAVLMAAENPDKELLNTNVEFAVLPDKQSLQPIRCVAELCRNRSITTIRWRPGSDEVIFTVTDYGKGRAQSIYGWNVVTGTVRSIVLSEGLVSGSQRYWDVPCALSSSTLVCVAAEADRPPRLEAIDMESGHRRILFEPNKGLEEDIATAVPAKLIRWTDERGREFTGQLFEASVREGKPPPLFVTFYNCYGFLRGGLGDEWPLVSMAEHGISALCINAIPEFRLDAVERYDQGRLAVESVVKYLSANNRIDPSRVGMGGLSYGSEVTLWTLMHSAVVTAASVSAPSVTPTYYLFNSLRGPFRKQLGQMWQLGAPEDTPGRWKEISPAFNIDKIRVPILFQMPEQEYRLMLDYALPLLRRQQAEIYVFPDEAHIKFQPRHKLAVYERNLDWFRFWLQGYEDADPLKAEQYRIWREMRSGGAEALPGVVSHDGA